MRTLTRNRIVTLMAVAMLTTLASVARSVPVGTAFTYQGSLVDNGGQASGPYDFRFTLFDATTGGVQIGSVQVADDVPVSSGVFSVSIDFGSLAFVGEARWLQIELRQGASTGAYTTLPRQKLTGAPYALGLSLPYYGAGITTGNLMTVQQIGTGNAGYFVNSNSTASLCYGIIGETWSTASQAAGVRGIASASSGLTIGVEGRGTASTSGTGMVGSGSATGGYFSATNADGYGLYAYGGGTGARVEGTGANATGLKAYGHGTGLGILVQNLDVGGPAISAANNGQGLNNPTLRLLNFQANTGMCVYASNNSTWTTARLDQAGTGECIWMRKPTAGNFIVANNGTSDIFWVDSDGITHTKVLEILGGADLSEKFDVGVEDGDLEPGTVVSIDAAHEGKLLVSSEPYDRRVAGIVSGAGGVQPGMLMGHDGTVASGAHPVALTGRVYCRVTAMNGPITPGDLLTTSGKPGYAMRVDDAARAQGAVIGKAMGSLASGEGLVLVLVGLQ